MMDRLGSDLLINCLKYLNYDELYRCNAINSFFSQCVHHDSLWKYWLSTLYGITRLEYPPGTGETQQETNSLSYMNCFKSWMVSFQGYSFHDIRKTKKWWERYELWCQEYAPEILTTLCPPATESELNSVENFLNQKLPSSLRLFYRFHNGQNIPFDRDPRTVESRGWGLFGGTHYYDSFANLRFLSLNRLQEVTLQCQNLISQGVHPRCLPHAKYSGTNPRGRTNQGVNFSLVDNNYYYDDDDISSPLSNHLPLSDPIPDNFSEIFAFATNGRRISKMYCIGKDHVGNSRGGIVYVNTRDFNFLPCHPTSCSSDYEGTSMEDSFFMLWIEEYMNRLERGIYRYQPIDLTDPGSQSRQTRTPKMISLIPLLPLYNPLPTRIVDELLHSRRNYGATTRITKGVETVACPIFIPERSSPEDSVFFWSYSIRLRLLREDPSRPVSLTRCQLITRHWDIYEPPSQETVLSHGSDAVGNHEQIDGEGVIGLTPQLDISYSQPEDPVHNWPFAYQSCSNSSTFPGQFAGHMNFVPNSIAKPTGPQFPVYLEPFSLGVPDFIY